MESVTDATAREARRIFAVFDVDESEEIDFDEFYLFVCILIFRSRWEVQEGRRSRVFDSSELACGAPNHGCMSRGRAYALPHLRVGDLHSSSCHARRGRPRDPAALGDASGRARIEIGAVAAAAAGAGHLPGRFRPRLKSCPGATPPKGPCTTPRRSTW